MYFQNILKLLFKNSKYLQNILIKLILFLETGKYIFSVHLTKLLHKQTRPSVNTQTLKRKYLIW